MIDLSELINSQYFRALMTWPACGCIVFVTVCRLNAMRGKVLLRVRLEYALWMFTAFAFLSSPWLGQWPGWLAVVVCYALAVIELCSWKAWRNDTPPAEATGPAPLSDR